MDSILTGWLLDLYPDPQGGLTLWLLEDDGGENPGNGRRLRLRQEFPVTFFAAGPPQRLRALWRCLQTQPDPPALARRERRDLFQPEPVTVLAVTVQNPIRQPGLFALAAQAFPDLTWYDADLPLPLRHAAIYGTFPLAKLRVVIDARNRILELETLETPWELDPVAAPLRVMHLTPGCDPRHAPPTSLTVQVGRHACRLTLEPVRPLLTGLGALLRRYDPDLLLTAWGDTWLLPRLMAACEQTGISLPLNRDERQAILQRPERSYQAYGQVIHRGRQVQLFGRWHIDIFNAMMFHDYGLDGILESARVTGLPVQQAARLSPGTGISAMQIVTALRQAVLVPWHKQQAETPRSALDLLHADQGGLVYQPIIGLHRDVAEIDFVSMYPGIMARFNVSPETVGPPRPGAAHVPELDLWVARDRPGLVPQTLQPLLEKRIAFKTRGAQMPAWDPRRALFKARAAAHKWLLVTCFGYLGYKNARFGRIEAHQAVTAYSRECLLRAKEAAEDAGFEALHLYVDGLWVHKPGCRTTAEIQPLLDEITARTRLPIALEGIYRWVAFLPSRGNEHIPVANRYFGVFQDGALKVRGIEARRRDTPPFIAGTQMGILERLAVADDVEQIPELLPGILDFLRGQLHRLRARSVPAEDLLVTQKLSREVHLYRSPSPAARAALQLERLGKPTRPGQPIRFLHTLGEPGVHAWDAPPPPPAACLDIPRYTRLLLRAAATVLQPFGIPEPALNDWLVSHAKYVCLPDSLPLWSISVRAGIITVLNNYVVTPPKKRVQ